MANTAINQGEIRPYVAELHGEIKTTSIKVAEHFGKQHRDVLKRIRNLECSEAFRLRNFAQTVSERPNPSGGEPIKSPVFEMTKDGFLILAMGYTGPVAMRIKEAYIAEFNRMEAALRGSPRTLETSKRSRVLLTFENGVVVESVPVPDDVMLIPSAEVAALWHGLTADQGRALNRIADFCKATGLLSHMDGGWHDG
jgi:Rha family phage regulatory protein